jgi:hydrogenase maturation protein HypF
MDGLGYGLDGDLWGGEFLIADCAGFIRAAHLRPLPMPGGAASIKQPWRMAAGALHTLFGEEFLGWDIPPVHRITPGAWPLLRAAIDRRINCPMTTSMGRVFDLVSAIVTGRCEVNYEGQAAVELELLAGRAPAAKPYPFELLNNNKIQSWGRPPAGNFGENGCLQLDFSKAIIQLIGDLRNGVAPGEVSARFHSTAACAFGDVCVAVWRRGP